MKRTCGTTLVVIAFVALSSVAHSAGQNFSPAFCEFSVTFPNGSKPKDMLSATASGAAATGRAGAAGLSAECWPYENQIPIDTYAQGIASQIQQRGGTVDNVSIDRNGKTGPQVVVTSRLKTGTGMYYVKAISFIGNKSRLDLTVIDKEIASTAQVDFRSSVKRK